VIVLSTYPATGFAARSFAAAAFEADRQRELYFCEAPAVVNPAQMILTSCRGAAPMQSRCHRANDEDRNRGDPAPDAHQADAGLRTSTEPK
jgi:hypothetical protein